MNPKPFTHFLAILFLGAIGVPSGTANAAFIYSLRFSQTEYSVLPGGIATVGLILREDGTEESGNQITQFSGLVTANVKVNWDAGGSKVNAEGNATFGGEFTTNLSKVLTANDIILNQSANDPGADGSPNGSFIREVSLGTLSFTVPSGGFTTTTINFSDPHSGVDDLVIHSEGLDGDIFLDGIVSFGSARISNPEPSTFLLTGLGLGSFLAVRRMRRRNAEVTASSDKA